LPNFAAAGFLPAQRDYFYIPLFHVSRET
jgi:hypothetical protein